MAENKWLADTALATVIDTDTLLVTGDVAAGDYNNGTELDLYCTVYLTVQWDTTAPAAGLRIGKLYIIPGDGEGTEVFAEGGDGTVGSDFIPQKIFAVGSFESIDPSITVDEVLSLPGIPLSPDGNRFVFQNTSGQQMDATWILKIKPYKLQSV